MRFILLTGLLLAAVASSDEKFNPADYPSYKWILVSDAESHQLKQPQRICTFKEYLSENLLQVQYHTVRITPETKCPSMMSIE